MWTGGRAGILLLFLDTYWLAMTQPPDDLYQVLLLLNNHCSGSGSPAAGSHLHLSGDDTFSRDSLSGGGVTHQQHKGLKERPAATGSASKPAAMISEHRPRKVPPPHTAAAARSQAYPGVPSRCLPSSTMWLVHLQAPSIAASQSHVQRDVFSLRASKLQLQQRVAELEEKVL